MLARSGPAQQSRGNPVSLSQAQESPEWQFVCGAFIQNCCAAASSLLLKAATHSSWDVQPLMLNVQPWWKSQNAISVLPLSLFLFSHCQWFRLDLIPADKQDVSVCHQSHQPRAFVINVTPADADVRESKSWWALFRRPGIIPQTGSPWIDLGVCQGLHLHTARCSGMWISPLQPGPLYSHSSVPLPVHFTSNLRSFPHILFYSFLHHPFPSVLTSATLCITKVPYIFSYEQKALKMQYLDNIKS